MFSDEWGSPEGEKNANYFITPRRNTARVPEEVIKIRKEAPSGHVVKVNGIVVFPVVDGNEVKGDK
ncbi:MAG: hypothetical protein Q4G65_18270 [bacterium]|nr:hypothetical protein [bacterium]